MLQTKITNPHSRTVSGKRKDLDNKFFRSKTEANYARYLNLMKVKWEYEPREFDFAAVRRGCVSYKPDFYLPDEDRWIEVKGWFDKKSITKLNRFKKYYPKEYKKLTLVVQTKKAINTAIRTLGLPYEDYRLIKKKASLFIHNWEH